MGPHAENRYWTEENAHTNRWGRSTQMGAGGRTDDASGAINLASWENFEYCNAHPHEPRAA